MHLEGVVIYRCHTCGQQILNPDGSPTGIPGILFVQADTGEVRTEPPFDDQTTSHHKAGCPEPEEG